MKPSAPGLAVLSLAAGLLLADHTPSRASTAVQIDLCANPLVAFDPEFVFGWEFLLSAPIQIHHIGLLDSGADGFEHLWKVVIFNLDGGGRNSVEFDQTTLTGNGFSYVESVAALHDDVIIHGPSLAPGHYVIAAGNLAFGDGDGAIPTDLMPAPAASFVTDPVITFVQGRYGLNEFHNEDLVFPNSSEPGLKYFGPNFQFDVVPEPSAGMLLVAGVLSCWVRQCRRANPEVSQNRPSKNPMNRSYLFLTAAFLLSPPMSSRAAILEFQFSGTVDGVPMAAIVAR